MAYGDYIPCRKCGVKLIYDGDRVQRQWWAERFGKEPEIECPDCKKEWVGLTDEERKGICNKFENENGHIQGGMSYARAIEAKLKEKNT